MKRSAIFLRSADWLDRLFFGYGRLMIFLNEGPHRREARRVVFYRKERVKSKLSTIIENLSFLFRVCNKLSYSTRTRFGPGYKYKLRLL
jgi:hypothetical protein